MEIQQISIFFKYILFSLKNVTIHGHRHVLGGQPPPLPHAHLLQPPEALAGTFTDTRGLKDSSPGPREQLYKQSERGANSPTLADIVKKFLLTTYSWESGKAQMAPDLHLWECCSKLPPSKRSKCGTMRDLHGLQRAVSKAWVFHKKCMYM